jgi:hypothetical protein
MDDLGRQLEANIAWVLANHDAINANLKLVKASRWRGIRNRRLLDRCWELTRENTRLLMENNLLLARRQQQINQRLVH